MSTPDFHDGINHGVAPVTYGQGTRPPRGNYAHAREDYTCDQRWECITPEEHELYRRLYERQCLQLPGLACDDFIEAVAHLGPPERIPRFETLSEVLYQATRWEIVAVPGLIPEEAFFSLLSQRKFPVTHWLRKPEEFDYVVEPDVFHDLFGHVPMLFNPWFADYMQAYGHGGLKASSLGACEFLARLYWYTVEFGLIRTARGLRAYGAGILSSTGELPYSIQCPKPRRLPLDLEQTMRTPYVIDSFQRCYFVIDDFERLAEMASIDFAPLYDKVRGLPALPLPAPPLKGAPMAEGS